MNIDLMQQIIGQAQAQTDEATLANQILQAEQDSYQRTTGQPLYPTQSGMDMKSLLIGLGIGAAILYFMRKR